jgi:hypothetical protein
MQSLFRGKMPKKTMIEREDEAYNLRRGLEAKRERERSLKNFERIKRHHQEYVARHGRTWLNHSH